MNELIKQKLPEKLWEKASEYSISNDSLNKYPELVAQILQSRSIDKKEAKESWLTMLTIMTPEQIAKLTTILLREQNKLKEIETKYEQKKLEIKKKYLQRWMEQGYVTKIKNIKDKEQVDEEQELEKINSIFDKLENDNTTTAELDLQNEAKNLLDNFLEEVKNIKNKY